MWTWFLKNCCVQDTSLIKKKTEIIVIFSPLPLLFNNDRNSNNFLFWNFDVNDMSYLSIYIYIHTHKGLVVFLFLMIKSWSSCFDVSNADASYKFVAIKQIYPEYLCSIAMNSTSMFKCMLLYELLSIDSRYSENRSLRCRCWTKDPWIYLTLGASFLFLLFLEDLFKVLWASSLQNTYSMV